MFSMNMAAQIPHYESDNPSWKSLDKRTRWMQLRDGLSTNDSYTRKLCMEGTSCPARTRCLMSVYPDIMKEGAAFDYFVTTISTRPSRRNTLMPTSFA